MTDLRMIRQGKFKVDNSIKVDEVSIDKLINIIDILDVKKVKLTLDISKKVLNGAPVDNIYNANEVLFIKDNEAVALYINENNKLKPYKMFKGGK